jgi:hypothetical protein
MLRRVLKSKQADRVLWVTLFLLTLFGVGVALKLSLNAERRSRWIGAAPPDSDLEDNPLVVRDRRPDSLSAPPAAASSHSTRAVSPKPDAISEKPARPAPRPLVVQQLTTPRGLKVAAMTPACRSAIETRGPWRDDRAARPWPECQDAGGNAMVVQLCTYARLTTGEWVLSENSSTIPRCRAELPLVREGKVRPVVGR